MKEKVYEKRLNKPFENERKLKKQIESIWKDVAFNLPEIRRSIKQFAGRLRTVRERAGQCIKTFMVKIYQNFNFFLSNFKFLILSVVIFNMKTFFEHKLIKKIKKSRPVP